MSPPQEARRFVPHREPLLLLDNIIEHDRETLVATYQVKETPWPASGMPAYIGIEIIAQAVAALETARSQNGDGSPALGVLLGTRSYRSAVANFPVGTTLTVRVTEKMADPSGFGAFQGTLYAEDGAMAAEALVKVYRPDDFWNYIRSTPTP